MKLTHVVALLASTWCINRLLAHGIAITITSSVLFLLLRRCLSRAAAEDSTVAAGATVTVKESAKLIGPLNGISAFQCITLCTDAGIKQLEELIVKRRIDLETRNDDGLTPFLGCALKWNRISATEMLMPRLVCFTAREHQGSHPVV